MPERPNEFGTPEDKVFLTKTRPGPGLGSAVLFVLGSVIGAGLFLTPE